MGDQGEYKSLLKKLKSKGGLKQVSCEFCMRDISSVIYVKCTNCLHFFICIPCYRQGREKAEHQRSHPYQVIDPLRFPLFEPHWSTKEELLLLEGLQKFGYGNWTSVCEWMSSTKSLAELEAHYHRVYVRSQDAPRPDTSRLISERDQNGCIAVYLDRYEEPMDTDSPEPEPSTPLELERHPLSDFPGFMSKRRDFEVEFENDSEMYLADLDFYEDDSAQDRALKFRQLDVYNKILDERELRRTFLLDRWPQELEAMKKAKGPAERSVYAAMKPFARFLSAEKHQTLCQGLTQEYTLRMQLEELKQAKAAGLRTEQDFAQFLSLKKGQLNPSRAREYEALQKECFSPTQESSEVQLTAVERSFIESNGVAPADYAAVKALVRQLGGRENEVKIRAAVTDTTLVDFILSRG